VIVANWTPVTRANYRIGVPASGTYREILNSDAAEWGGSGNVNAGGLNTEEIPWQGQAQSITLTLPPLGVTYLEVS
jgi:1,4-alpha-glucan branching enzyme